MRPLWTGVISFGLVNIPVNLYSGSVEAEFDFDYLHKKDLSPIRQARFCKAEEKEVPFSEIVRGVKVDGAYVVLQEEDFAFVDPAATRTVRLEDFVSEHDVDPIYIEKPYFLVPLAGAEKPYRLLVAALAESKRVGIGRFVLRNREYLGMVRPAGEALALIRLRAADAIRVPELPPLEHDKITPREVEVAVSLIEALARPFDPERYTDEYLRKLRTIIHEKASGHTSGGKVAIPKPTDVSELMDALKRSLEQRGERTPKSKAGARRKG